MFCISFPLKYIKPLRNLCSSPGVLICNFSKQNKKFLQKWHEPKVVQDLNIHGQKITYKEMLDKQPVTKCIKLKDVHEVQPCGYVSKPSAARQPAKKLLTSASGSCYLCRDPDWWGSFPDRMFPASSAISGWGIFSTDKVSHAQNITRTKDKRPGRVTKINAQKE